MKNRHEGLAEMKKDGVTYCNMFWLFMFGNVLGVLLEGTWCRLIFGHWETHVATIWGPFSLIYGVGAVMFYISGEKIRSTGYKGVVARFCSIAIVATVFELACGLLLEYGMGMKAWDYSKSFMNYKGLICLKMTLLWGLAGVIFSYMVVPKLKKVCAYAGHGLEGRVCRVIDIYDNQSLVHSRVHGALERPPRGDCRDNADRSVCRQQV